MDILTLKKMIKEYIKLLYICPNYKKKLREIRRDKQSKIILFGTPAHGNLGDQAIAISELDFLHNIAENRPVIEIPMPLFKTHRKYLKKYIGCSDTIIVSGGGWMGNLWIHNEITIREIVSDYKKNKIVIFPQTLYYTDDEYGKITISDTKKIFAQHSNLILTVRDLRSYECAKKQLGLKNEKNLFFCPDMVVYGTLAQILEKNNTNNLALICLRNDIEKKCNVDSIKESLANAGYVCVETTTVLNKLVSIRERLQIVSNKIKEFQSASIVITDRLHAMLFALLAGTPCIAFDNATGKVFGVGEYLKNSGMPVYLTDHLDVSIIDEMLLKRKEFVLSENLKSYFIRLGDIVNNEEVF